MSCCYAQYADSVVPCVSVIVDGSINSVYTRYTRMAHTKNKKVGSKKLKKKISKKGGKEMGGRKVERGRKKD